MKIEVFDGQVPFAAREKALDYCSHQLYSWLD